MLRAYYNQLLRSPFAVYYHGTRGSSPRRVHSEQEAGNTVVIIRCFEDGFGFVWTELQGIIICTLFIGAYYK